MGTDQDRRSQDNLGRRLSALHSAVAMPNKKKRSSYVHRLGPRSLSRKRARIVTTFFHKLTRERAQVVALGLATTAIDQQLEDSRAAYQRASQVSTSFHSTSKWVLGCLGQNGMLYGSKDDTNSGSEESDTTQPKKRRATRLLEVGAINTELLDAAQPSNNRSKHRLHVRAIDIHSMHPERIEEADFLTMPLPAGDNEFYDVVVCSMVLNCVATPEDRGRMLARLYRSLRSQGGLLYLTIPKTCLQLSPFMDRSRFEALLTDIGFEVCQHEKDSPKIAYFVLSRTGKGKPDASIDEKWGTNRKIHRGQKFKNDFAVVARCSFWDET